MSSQKRYTTRNLFHSQKQKKRGQAQTGVVIAPDSQEILQQEISSTTSQMTPSFNSLDPNIKIPFPRKDQVNRNVQSPEKKKPTKKVEEKKIEKKNLEPESSDEFIAETVATNKRIEDDAFWIGDPIFKNEEATFYRSFEKDGKIFRLEDCVRFNTQKKENPPFFAKIQALYENKEYVKYIEGNWFFKPEDTNSGRKPFHGSTELLLCSEIEASQVLDGIEDKCTIEHYDQFKTRLDFPKDVYFFREMYNVKTGEISQSPMLDKVKPPKRILLEEKLAEKPLHETKKSRVDNTQVLFGSIKENSSKSQDLEFEDVVQDLEKQSQIIPPVSLKRLRKSPIKPTITKSKDLDEDLDKKEELVKPVLRKRRLIQSESSDDEKPTNMNDEKPKQESSDDEDTSTKEKALQSLQKERMKRSPKISDSEKAKPEKPELPLKGKRLFGPPESGEKKEAPKEVKESLKPPITINLLDSDESNDFEQSKPVKKKPYLGVVDVSVSDEGNKVAEKTKKSLLFFNAPVRRQSTISEMLEKSKLNTNVNSKSNVNKKESKWKTLYRDDDQEDSGKEDFGELKPLDENAFMQSQKKLLEVQKTDVQPTSEPPVKTKMNNRPPGFTQDLLRSSQSTSSSQASQKTQSSLKDVMIQSFKQVAKDKPKKKEPIVIDSEESSLSAFQEDDIEMDEEDIRREKEDKKFRRMVRKAEKTASISPEVQNTNISTKKPQLLLQNKDGEIVEPPKRQKKKIDYDRELRRMSKETSKKKVRSGEYESDRSEDDDDDEEMKDFIVYEEEADQPISDNEEIISEIKQRSEDIREYSQESLTEWTGGIRGYNLKTAFSTYLQYLISAFLDEDFQKTVNHKGGRISSIYELIHRESYFKPAILKIQDAVITRKEFLLRSTVWEANFKEDLESFPIYRSWKANNSSTNCEACQRSGHPAYYEVSLEGPQYNAVPVWNNASLPPPETDEIFNKQGRLYKLGRFCHRRTELFHKLHHYKYHLCRKIEKKLEHIDSGVDANTILDTFLDNTIWVEEVFHDLKSLIEEADEFGRENLSTT